MKTLDRYIAMSFIQALVIWLVVMLGLRIVADLFVNMDEFSETRKYFDNFGGVIGHVLRYYGYQSLIFFAQMGGVTVVAAAAFAIYRMNQSNELTAMMASGVSLHRVLRPIVVCSLLVSALVMIDRELIISNPYIRTMIARERDDPKGSEAMSVMMLTDGNESVWYSNEYIPNQQQMNKPIIFLRDRKYGCVGRISGAKATAGQLQGQEGWFITSSETASATLVNLDETTRYRYPPASARTIWTSLLPGDVKNAMRAGGEITDEDQRMIIRAVAPAPGAVSDEDRVKLDQPQFTFVRKDGSVLAVFRAQTAIQNQSKSGLSSWRLEGGELFFPSDLKADDIPLRQRSRWLDYMSIAELTNLLKLERITDPPAAIMAKHVRITEPLNNLLMLLVGVPFILSRERNVKVSAVRCMLMVVAFYAMVYLSRYVGLPPIWAAWLPALVFGPIAAIMLDSVKT